MDAQQNYFNELAEKMMKKEITTEQACSLFKDFCDEGNAEEMEMLECCLDGAEKEIEELKESNEKLGGVLNLLTYFNKKLKEENEELKKENEKLKEARHFKLECMLDAATDRIEELKKEREEERKRSK